MTQDPKETPIDEPQTTEEESTESIVESIEAIVETDEQTERPLTEAALADEAEALDEDQWQTGPTSEETLETDKTAEEGDGQDTNVGCVGHTETTDEKEIQEQLSEPEDEQTSDDQDAPESTDQEEDPDTSVGCAPHTKTTDEEGIEEELSESKDEQAPDDQEEPDTTVGCAPHTEAIDEEETSELSNDEDEPTTEATSGNEDTTEDDTETPLQTDEESELSEDEQPATIESVVEAILFASDEPLTDNRLAKIIETTSKQVRECIDSLNQKYEANHNAFRIEKIAGGYQMLTLTLYNQWLSKMLRVRSDTKLSPAAMETLAIIAYKQPVIRVDIEAIRGVAVGEVIRSLMYKSLVKIVGRAEILGRPMLYGTTKKFLEVFGLNSLKDLPKAEELKKPD